MKAEVTNEAFHNIIWMIYPEDMEVTIPEDDPNTRTFIMPAREVEVRVDFTMTPIPYLSRSWDGHEIIEERDYCRIYSYLSGNTTDSTVTLTGGWYVVDGEVTFGSGTKLVIDENAKVNLLLMDGATLNANNGIYINENGYASLTIWVQEGETGKLIAKSGSGAGIGGINDGVGGNLVINGGIIEATGTNGSAGIGNGSQNSSINSIEINGGTVDALAYQRSSDVNEKEDEYLGGAGIGSGRNADQEAPINIRGGDVTAKGGVCAAGIGAGHSCAQGGLISIRGGSVYAECDGYGSGLNTASAIGRGNGGSTDGSLTIYKEAKVANTKLPAVDACRLRGALSGFKQ